MSSFYDKLDMIAIVDMIAFLIQDIVLVIIIYFTATKLLKSRNRFFPAFYIFALISFLLSGLYWAAYTILKADTTGRMPFAADEIADSAALLLLSTGLVADKKVDRTAHAGEVIFAVMFTIANVVLWIFWSGEWLQDIIFGIPYSYLLWLIIRGIADTKPLTTKTVIALRIASVAIVTIFFITEISGRKFDLITDPVCYVLMFGLLIWLLIMSIKCMNLYVSALYLFATFFVSFGSASIFYDIAVLFNISAHIILYLSLKKEVLK